MRLPFFRPKDTAAPRKRPAAAPVGDDALVQLARTRARQRLVGALVLLAVGVIGFPLLFDTQPRPMSPDMPIEVMRPDASTASKPAQTPSHPPKALPLNLPPADAGVEATAEPAAPVPQAQAAQSAVAPVRVAASAQATASAPAARIAATAPKPAASAVSLAPAAKPAALPASTLPAASAASPGRFVVQAGAYTDAAKLREARQKVERLGLKTYTQVIDNDAGTRTRVRVGPFATRQEAEAVAARVKATGLQVNVLNL